MTIAPVETVSQAAAIARADQAARQPPPVQPSATPAAAPSSSTAPLLNPDPVINPSLGIVVLQYFSRAGDVTKTYPSRQQLDSYELHGMGAAKP
jgi:hypothetical protein